MRPVEKLGAHEPAPPLYVDTKGAAQRYRVSPAHWRRLVDAGRAPQPIRLGRLVRWPLVVLDQWDADGNRPCRTTRGARS